MGSLASILPQGPNVHCDIAGAHGKHSNPTHENLTAWCDGIPILDPFVELTLRVPLRKFFGDALEEATQQNVLGILTEEGLGVLVDEIGDEGTTTVLRVRAGDGEDRTYPLVKGDVSTAGQGRLW